MATNEKFDAGSPLTLAVPSGTVSGGPVNLGRLTGVALIDRDANGNATVKLEGVFNLSVKGANDAGNVAIAAGDPVYFTVGDTPKLNAKKSGVLFGTALAAVTSGSTTTIAVRLVGEGGTSIGASGVAAGYKVARGETALGGSNPTAVATGLTTVIAFVPVLKGTAAPGVGTSVLTANIAGAAGNVDVYAWKVTSSGNATLVASTGTESFYWVAVGT